MFCWRITALVVARGPKVATSIHHGVNLMFLETRQRFDIGVWKKND